MAFQDSVKKFVVDVHERYSELAIVAVFKFNQRYRSKGRDRSSKKQPPKVATVVELENILLNKIQKPVLEYLAKAMRSECEVGSNVPSACGVTMEGTFKASINHWFYSG